MSQPFDPYLRWLGIRDPQRPPNHYRLLGVEVFEADPEVIAGAADRQMAHVRSFQTGQFAEVSQKILNELAAARVCLLKADRKAAYDAQLRAAMAPAKPAASPPKMPARAVAAVARPVAAQPARPAVATSPFAEIADVAASKPSTARRKQKKNTSLAPLAFVAMLILAVGAIGLFAYNAGQSPKNVAKARVTKPEEREPKAGGPETSPKTDDKDKPSIKPEPATSGGGDNENKEPHQPVVEESDPTEQKGPIVEELPVELPTEEPKTAPQEQPPTDTETPPTENPPKEETTAADEELPILGPKPPDPSLLTVPAEEDRKAALQRIREIFDKDLDAAKTPDAKIKLAETLIEQAAGTKDDPTAEFVLLKLAEDLAIGASDLGLAHKVVDLKAKRFAIDPLAAKADDLFLVNRQAKTAAARENLPSIASELVDGAIEQENFPLALKLNQFVLQAATKARDRDTMKSCAAREKSIKEMQKQFDLTVAAIEKIKADPTDAEASFQIGAYLCFAKNDWDRGLLRLSKGENQLLQDAAMQELSKPSEPARQKQLADLWLKAADTLPASSAVMRNRALHWYEQAVEQLSGLEKAEVEKRVGQLSNGETQSGGASPNARQITVLLSPEVALAFSRIPAGKFIMGSPSNELERRQSGDSNETQHLVVISKPFYLATTEVTQAQWMALMGSNPSSFKISPQHPVEVIKKEQAEEFCARLSKAHSTKRMRFRLPTEAEWEYACRAGSTAAFCFGDDSKLLSEFAWWQDNSGKTTHAVAQLKPNRWGLFDMHGNVEEFVSDLQGAYDLTVSVDPRGPATGTTLRVRGGAYDFPLTYQRSASRSSFPTSEARPWVGFRPALDLDRR